ncbi:FumA C-terminus/TtdB family hydratase beta subunit [Leadbettera azotonutricia]|uniref:Fumarate hydratase n=1 Tax=Leadbettera azotonutricia (strain ATCC BAA-888 / DSM 13862 / ZAS-9) TaxID=545695 RepID=F5YEZ1_LEAAZ|nr:FumA C-terminus/TtdB family hydratase beta subunit [Leadbettera azotonutricia]AEF83141.1 fumarate hydratase [Leadbettera azotonutricia ZAS-9]
MRGGFEPLVEEAFKQTSFELIDTEGERPRFIDGRLFIPPGLLSQAAEEGFRRLSFFFRESHLAMLAEQLALAENDKKPGNDGFVLNALLRNAVIAAKGELALCQDTGTAVIYGWKSENVFTGSGDDDAWLESGIGAAYKKNNLRLSQIGASSFLDEFNTGNNLPAQIQIHASGKNPVYRFLFIAKGGGSSNKTSLFSMTKSLLEEQAFEKFLEEKIKALGTAACPPYRLAVVVGGTSPEFNLEACKLASAEALDSAPYFEPGEDKEKSASLPWIRRDKQWEEKAMSIGRRTGLGAQFGGSSLLLDARVLRLPRHAASCPVSIGVSCAAHRNLYAYIDSEGLHLEKTVTDPAKFLKERGINLKTFDSNTAIIKRISVNKGIKEVCKELSNFNVGDKILLSGKLLMARDAAHLKWHNLLKEGKALPEYLYAYPVYYAGPAATPPGKVIGSLGPTTAGRMDPYGEEFMSRGCSLVTVAKGNRSAEWKKLCSSYGAFYLGTIGGAAALLSEENVTGNELLDYPELGMEAVRLITVKDLPVFIIIDNKGNSLY